MEEYLESTNVENYHSLPNPLTFLYKCERNVNGMRVASYGLRVTGCRLRVAGDRCLNFENISSLDETASVIGHQTHIDI